MRGLYTIGVLDFLMEQEIWFPYVIGVSAGACSGVSYVSRQKGRNYRVNTGYIKDKRYVGIGNWLRERSLFGMDFLFDTIPNELDPFDYERLAREPAEFICGVTDVDTGKPVYFGKEHLRGESTVLRASSSIPCFSPIVHYQGGRYLDGGTSDPIPVRKALEDGCDKLVIVLTRDREFVRKKEKGRLVYRWVFRNDPAMVETLDKRHLVYNQTLELIRQLEQEGKAIVIAPKHPLQIGRFEKNLDKLKAAHRAGYEDAREKVQELKELGK